MHTYDVHTGRGEGGTPKEKDSTEMLLEFDSDRGGVKKSKCFADVICSLCVRDTQSVARGAQNAHSSALGIIFARQTLQGD